MCVCPGVSLFCLCPSEAWHCGLRVVWQRDLGEATQQRACISKVSALLHRILQDSNPCWRINVTGLCFSPSLAHAAFRVLSLSVLQQRRLLCILSIAEIENNAQTISFLFYIIFFPEVSAILNTTWCSSQQLDSSPSLSHDPPIHLPSGNHQFMLCI